MVSGEGSEVNQNLVAVQRLSSILTGKFETKQLDWSLDKEVVEAICIDSEIARAWGDGGFVEW